MEPREWAEEALADWNDEALFMDGHDDAIIGVTVGQAGLKPVVVYDERLIIETLIAEGLSEGDAWDHYGFNIQGGYFGEDQPLIIRTPDG